MSSSLSTFYLSQMRSTNPSSIVRKFTFQNSDITDFVTTFPTIVKEAEEAIATDFTINIENARQAFNTLRSNKNQFLETGKFEYGYKTASGTNDIAQLFTGELIESDINDDMRGQLIFQGKMHKLTIRTIGDENDPAIFINANPASMFWVLATSYGQLDSTESSANTDIDYDELQSWGDTLENIAVSGLMTGQTVLEQIDVLKQITDSIVYEEKEGKITFTRWQGSQFQDVVTVVDSTHQKANIRISAREMINKISVGVDRPFINGVFVATEGTGEATVSGNIPEEMNLKFFINPNSFSVSSHNRLTFRVTSTNARARDFVVTLNNSAGADQPISFYGAADFNSFISRQNTDSISNFGEFQTVFDEQTIWYTDSLTADNLAQRIVFRRNEPKATYTIETPMTFLETKLGDDLLFTSKAFSVSAVRLGVKQYLVDTEREKMTIVGDDQLKVDAFILDDTAKGVLVDVGIDPGYYLV